ncbi:putative ribonuclease H-like superfamily [Helianthus annuus]|nr:putative ribonuclease H-like superfamily [Helianthus annuus]KAJ0619248.1 putative ribonuclease H-like superfamily [Helianthus annuus]KAJ0777700.1 putative ribonuclease H-like superfamily [Helianthus annuus]KAJ0940524.1 putative ribonuclease H-like superfamily [Helianthus annuus]
MMRYAREDTHYLLYIYDLMKRKLLSSSTDPNCPEASLVEQMPVTTGKLRHLLKSRHPYIERNLGSIVGIIMHSVQNGAAFEPVAKKIVEDDYLTRVKIVKKIHQHN